MTEVEKRKRGVEAIGYFLKWNDLFRFTLIAANLFLLYRNNALSNEIDGLRKANIYLSTQHIANLKAINESPLAWWKKEVFDDGEIVMRDYNDAFYSYLLKPLSLGRYFYVNKSDYDVFPTKMAASFYAEDFSVYKEFMMQTPDANGIRPMLIKEYSNHWVDLKGEINKDGYWRYVRQEEGHIYVYGSLKKPRPDKGKMIIQNNREFIKPKELKIRKRAA